MSRLYPYQTLFGDLTMKVTDVKVDAAKPDVHVVDLNGDALDLYLVDRVTWDKVGIELEVTGPPSGIQKFDSENAQLAMTAVAQCGATSIRIAMPLTRSATDPALWSGSIQLSRRNFSGAADLHAVLSGTVDGREWRFLRDSNPWALRFDPPAVPPMEGSVDVKWVNFRGDNVPPMLAKYGTEAFYVDLAGAAPVVYLNLDFENLQSLLEDRPRRGPDLALHQAVRASIAAKVWAAMFNAALGAVMGAMSNLEPGEAEPIPTFPGPGWQSQVLRRVLAVMYEDRSPDDGLVEIARLWHSEEGANAVQSEVATAVEKQIEAGKLLRRAARIVYEEVA